MTIFLVCISIMFIGLWILWRLVSINPPDLPTQARSRGVVLPKDFVGPTFNSTRTERDAAVARTYNPRPTRANFWSEEEP